MHYCCFTNSFEHKQQENATALFSTPCYSFFLQSSPRIQSVGRDRTIFLRATAKIGPLTLQLLATSLSLCHNIRDICELHSKKGQRRFRPFHSVFHVYRTILIKLNRKDLYCFENTNPSNSVTLKDPFEINKVSVQLASKYKEKIGIMIYKTMNKTLPEGI